MKIEEGKYYCTRDGEKVGPMRPEAGHWHISDGRLWSDEGERWSRNNSHNDIVSEWVDDANFKIGDRVVQDKSYECQDLVEHLKKYWDKHNIGEYKGYFYVTDVDQCGWIRYSTIQGGKGPRVTCEVMKHATTTPAIVALVENGQPKPSVFPVFHNTEEGAKREADRLAANNNGKEFAVFTQTYSSKQEKTYDHEWQRIAARGDKIGAVRELRAISGLYLREAKLAVEKFIEMEKI